MILGNRVTVVAPDVTREKIRFGLWQPGDTPLLRTPGRLYDHYLRLTSVYATEIWDCYRRQYGVTYRRTFTSADFAFTDEMQIGAFTVAKTGPQNIYLRLGNLVAVEDATLAVLSHPTYDFVARQDCLNDGHSGVRRLPTYWHFDKWRYLDYEFVRLLIDSGAIENPGTIATLIGKFVPTSGARCCLSAFVAQIALHWIIAHENAHYYLGHLTEFASWGASAGGGMQFDELVAIGKTKEELSLRQSAEIAADDAATQRIVDHFFDFDVFELGIVPEKYIQTSFLKGELCETAEDLELYVSMVEGWQKGREKCDLAGMAKRIFLVRTACLGIFVALCCFERQTRKTDAYRNGYPPFGIRMLNIIVEVLNRTMSMRMSRGWQVGGRVCLLGEASLTGILLVRDLRNVMRETLLLGDVMHDSDMAGHTHESLLGGDQGVLLRSISSYLVLGSVEASMANMREAAERLESDLGNKQPERPAEVMREVEERLDLSKMVTDDQLFRDFALYKKLSYEHALKIFWPARRTVNQGIGYKVDEDQMHLERWKTAFERLLRRIG